MVAKMEGFSIRGYTVKMRTVDLKKCWPFVGDGPRERMEGESAPQLPPMTIPSFRFWLDELPHSERPPDPGLDLLAGNELAARSPSSKGKQRGPKKRSIAELFATAPQVDVAEEVDSWEGEGKETDQNQGEEDRREDSREGKIGSTDLLSNATVSEAPTTKPEKIKERVWLNYKKKRSTVSKRKRFGAAKKEKIHNSKVSSVLHISQLLQGSVCKQSGNMSPVDDQMKKQSKVKSVSKKRSSKTVRSSKLLSKNQEVAKVFPARSILKNKARPSSTKRKALNGDFAGGNLIKSRRISNKRVSFEDDVLGPNKKSFPMDLPQLQSLYTMKDASNPPNIEWDHVLKESANGAAKAGVPESTVRSKSENSQSVGDQYHAALPTDISSRNCLETEKTSLVGTIDLNYTAESFGDLNCLDPAGSDFSPESSESGSTRILDSTYMKGMNSNSGLQAEKTNSQFQADESLLMTSSARTLPVTMGVSRSPIGDEHIAVGLPPKSQGEPPKSCSSAKFDLNDLFSMQNQLSGSESSSPVLNLNEPADEMDRSKTKEKFPFIANDQLRRFQDPAGAPTVSSSDIIEMQGLGGIGVQKHQSTRKPDPSFQKDPIPQAYHGTGEHAQSHNSIDREKCRAEKNLGNDTRPAFHGTMRLMGQDVSVPDGMVDEKMVAEQVPDEHFRIPWPQREQVTYPESETSTENQLHRLEDPSSVYHIPTADPQFRHKHFDSRPQRMPSSGHFFPIGNHRSEVNRSYHSFPQEAFLPGTSNSTINSNSITSSVEMANQLPVMASHPRNVSQQMFRNSTHHNSQSLSYTNQSTFFSPVPNHDNWNLSETLSAHAPSRLPQWLLNVNQGAKILGTNTDPISVRYPFTRHGANSLSVPSQIPTSVVPPPLYNRNVSNILGSSTQSELHSPPFVLSRSPTVNLVNGDKIKSRDGKESNFKYFKLLDRPNITTKRPGSGFDDFMRQVKRPNSTVHGNSDAPSGRRQIEQLLDCIPCNTGYPETPDYGNKVMDAARDGEEYGFRTAPRSSSVKLGDGSNAGPIKLSAGAKHILRPSRNMDKDNSRPIPSTIRSIPLATVNSSGLISASQKRAAKIYRF